MYQVLLVDDEYMILNGLKKIIDWNHLGFQVVSTAENAMEGLAILENQKIDLVVTDVTMPEMNGLEFIEAAQKEHHTFEFMILSGYQEFDYLKGGMQLGAINYLMKPVNKSELIESLEKVKQRLDRQNEQKNQQEIYQEVLFNQWLNEELDEASEEEILEKIGSSQKRVLLVQLPRMDETKVNRWLKENQEPFYYQRNYGETVLFTMLLSERNISTLCDFIKKTYGQEKWLISIGRETKESDKIPEAFQQAKDHLKLHQFYGREDQKIFYADHAAVKEQTIDFSAFTRVLQGGQLETAQQMITSFFEQFQTAVMTPEDIRHFSFLLFMDIQRELISLEDEEYLEGVQTINQAETVQELHQFLLSLLKNRQKQKRYSENVEKVLCILHEHYQEPLTLKEVSENLHLNVMYLGQLFKKETKKSFSAYLNHQRMEQAKWLLLHSNQNINEISSKIGYNNTTYFSKLFKKIVGKSPKEFREQRG
ncbi:MULTISPECIES: response regulator transcription factor [unclassified Enterococcus]|uniref:response regulator transcription factor n=1 Tax=unclassified Enterococcus TaxID=2608891 RepID=UPI0013EE0C18|nr:MULTISPECIES: response regulator transcription factor [unclassified Enterococcus]